MDLDEAKKVVLDAISDEDNILRDISKDYDLGELDSAIALDLVKKVLALFDRCPARPRATAIKIAMDTLPDICWTR